MLCNKVTFKKDDMYRDAYADVYSDDKCMSNGNIEMLCKQRKGSTRVATVLVLATSRLMAGL